MNQPPEYQNLTLEGLKEAISGYFNKEKINPSLTYEELRKRVLPGYSYSVTAEGERKTSVRTGRGGIMMIIDSYESAGVPAWDAAESIICDTDQGPYPLSALTVNKTNGE